MKTVHRQPNKQRELKSIPAFVNKGDELISDLDATKLFHEAGKDIGNSFLYKAYRNDLLSAYIVNSKRYYIKSEIMAAIKQFPRDVPRKDGYYPCRAKLKAEVERLKTEVEALKGKEQFTRTYKYISIA